MAAMCRSHDRSVFVSWHIHIGGDRYAGSYHPENTNYSGELIRISNSAGIIIAHVGVFENRA